MEVKEKFERIVLSIMIVLCMVLVVPVNAQQVYTSQSNSNDTYNTYYQRSQHTYAYKNDSGEHKNIGSGIYILYPDKDIATEANNEGFNFTDKFTSAYKPTRTDYFLAYCADLNTDFKINVTYNVIDLIDSKVINENSKNHLRGIIQNSYPFISYDEMVEKLMDAGILVKAINGSNKEVITSQTNVKESPNKVYYITITDDELLQAVQMAIFHFTNPGGVTDLYYNTQQTLSRNPVMADYEYTPTGSYPVAERNIQAIYDYLITLEAGPEETNSIKLVETQKVGKDYYIRLTLNKEVNDKDDIMVEYTINNNNVSKKLSELEKGKNNTYVDKINNVDDISSLKVKLFGTVYIENMVHSYENVDGATTSQTLIGMAPGNRSFSALYNEGILSVTNIVEIVVENPNTIIGLSLLGVVICLIFLTLLVYFNKKRKFIEG